MKFRLNDEPYDYPENLTLSWDMIEKDVDREKRLSNSNHKFIPDASKPGPYTVTKRWWQFWIK